MALWFCNQIARRNSKYFPTLSAGPSDVLRGETHLLPQTAGEADDEDLGGGHAESGDWGETGRR